MRFLKENLIILIIVLTAALLRFYKLEALTTFLGDQGYDFLIVKRMIVDGDFTLLGPKIGPYNQIGNLYLGPAYYYLLAPFLFIFKLDPIGGAVLTASLAVLTVLLIYKSAADFISKETAILASSLYALNTLLIDQSRSPSNPHLIPFFSIVTIYSLFQVTVKNSTRILWPFFVGFSLGINFQLHYLSAVLFLPIVMMLLAKKKLLKIIIIFIAFTIAISPQILFEIRHDFFITNLFLRQIRYGQNILPFDLFLSQLLESIKIIQNVFLNNRNFSLIILTLILMSSIYYFRKRSLDLSIFAFFTITIIISTTAITFFSGSPQIHYFAPIYPAFVLLLATSFAFLISGNFLMKIIGIFLLVQIFSHNILSLNLSAKEGYTMPKGLNLKGIKISSEIISKDISVDEKFNIASTLDGDTRARPYRYLVEVYGKIPQEVEKYPESDILYLVSKDEEEKIKRYTVWEVSSFNPFEVKNRWDIQNGIKLYKLSKIRSLQ